MAFDEEQLREAAKRFKDCVDEMLDVLRQADLMRPTPDDARAVQRQADRERDQFAWLCVCGSLNHGYWDSDAVCGGCRFSIEKPTQVQEHYRLVAVEGLTGDL